MSISTFPCRRIEINTSKCTTNREQVTRGNNKKKICVKERNEEEKKDKESSATPIARDRSE